jgi:FkbM family methyltransferase
MSFKFSWLALLFIALSLFGEYPHYVKIDKAEKRRIKSLKNGGGYLDPYYTSIIERNSDVKTVLEIGSRDAKDALKLSEHYKCHVYAFECNPHVLENCKKNIGRNPNVTLVPYAVWNRSEFIDFYAMVKTAGVDYNPGASSCFPVSKSGYHGTFVQEKVTVKAVRLDDWLSSQKISQIDLLCMDAQGAAMNVLEGLGSYLAGVKYIITEMEHKTIYEGEVLRDQVDAYLEANGFTMYVGKVNRFFGDYLYIRKDIISDWEKS